tara:strand:- start:11700 stop:12494 length:795 start_codon:yes stop_codon:yes gene_type:complete
MISFIKNSIHRTIHSLLKPFVKFYVKISISNEVITNGPFTWDSYGVASRTSKNWFSKNEFDKCYKKTWDEIEKYKLVWNKRKGVRHPINRKNFKIEYNINMCATAAAHCVKLDGDFIEFGVGVGFYSRLIMRYLKFNKLQKKFLLVDRWSPGDTSSYIENFETVKKIFKYYKNTILIRGHIPEVLSKIQQKKFSYVYLDLNNHLPEKQALEFIFPLVVKGGIIMSDDFGFKGHEKQEKVFVEFFAKKNIDVFYLPTGQGMVIKP